MSERPEVARLRSDIRDFAANAIPSPLREKIDAGVRLGKADTVAWMKLMQQRGWATAQWPREYGGLGWDVMLRFVLDDELARLGLPRLVPFGVKYAGPVLYTFGSAWQKERFLPSMRTTDEWWAQGYSEPGSGSDLASLRTRAERRDGHFVVNGQKTWTTHAQWADWIFCLVRTSSDDKKQAGISFLLIDMKSPGVTVRPIASMDGGDHLNEVWFEDVRVPAENLVGEENHGWDYAKFLLGNERVGVAPVGATKRVLAQAKEWARGTTYDGGTLLEDPLVAARIAELENELLALELTALRVVAHSADGKPHPASSVLKLKGTELQQAVSELVVDRAGPAAVASGAGDDSDLPGWTHRATPAYLNLRKASIYGGSNEIQRQIIARTILGL
jgi:alkylation response protein AidB-like acyl-CoA dehydrogenase